MSEENRRAGNALLEVRESLTGNGLVIADEGFAFDGTLKAKENCLFITNRIDIKQTIKSKGGVADVSDFDFSQYEAKSVDYILLRLPKFKVLARYLYSECERLLKDEGCLIIAGFNQEGVKRIIKLLGDRLGEIEDNQLLGKGLRLATIVKNHDYRDQSEVDESTAKYQESITIIDPDSDIQYYSKPGIYGFDKVDQGSRFLMEYLTTIERDLAPKVLDLGAGFGYLSIQYATLLGVDKCEIIATDANITATIECQKNFEQYSIQGEVMLDDCGSMLSDRSFKTIIANPPFHQGFTTSSLLTEKFIAATARLLKSRGSAYFVLNRFVAVEAICDLYKLRYEEVATNRQFKILRLNR